MHIELNLWLPSLEKVVGYLIPIPKYSPFTSTECILDHLQVYLQIPYIPYTICDLFHVIGQP